VIDWAVPGAMNYTGKVKPGFNRNKNMRFMRFVLHLQTSPENVQINIPCTKLDERSDIRRRRS